MHPTYSHSSERTVASTSSGVSIPRLTIACSARSAGPSPEPAPSARPAGRAWHTCHTGSPSFPSGTPGHPPSVGQARSLSSWCHQIPFTLQNKPRPARWTVLRRYLWHACSPSNPTLATMSTRPTTPAAARAPRCPRHSVVTLHREDWPSPASARTLMRTTPLAA